MFDKLLDFVVKSVRDEENRKREDEKRNKEEPGRWADFYVDKKVADLIDPCKTKAVRHREREKVYTKKLQIAEKKLRTEGVSVDVYDHGTGRYVSPQNMQSITSGLLSSTVQNFQPRINQQLMDDVNNAKAKMLEHRGKAEQFEKCARAFAIGPDVMVRLTIEDIHFFGLGEPKE